MKKKEFIRKKFWDDFYLIFFMNDEYHRMIILSCSIAKNHLVIGFERKIIS